MRGGGDPADREFCHAILPKVSRTFALGIRLLPTPLKEAVRTSYLLCRIADTIEDATLLPSTRKGELLGDFRQALDHSDHDHAALAATFPTPATDEEVLVQGYGSEPLTTAAVQAAAPGLVVTPDPTFAGDPMRYASRASRLE